MRPLFSVGGTVCTVPLTHRCVLYSSIPAYIHICKDQILTDDPSGRSFVYYSEWEWRNRGWGRRKRLRMPDKGAYQNSSCSTFDLFSFSFALQLASNDPWAEFLCHDTDPEECTSMFQHQPPPFFYVCVCGGGLLQVGFMHACNRLLSLTSNLLKVHICL